MDNGEGLYDFGNEGYILAQRNSLRIAKLEMAVKALYSKFGIEIDFGMKEEEPEGLRELMDLFDKCRATPHEDR